MTTSQIARIGAFSLIVSLSVAPVAFANSVGGQGTVSVVNASPAKVIVCHRTNAVDNPYTRIPVAVSSVDGNTANDNGNNEDHLDKHIGPVFDALVHLKSSDNWGDIIPPFDEDGNPYASTSLIGLNWTTDGQAIWNKNCNIPASTTTPGSGNGNPTPTISVPTPTISATPAVIGSGSVLAAQAPATELPKTGTSFINLIVAFAAAIGAGVYSHLRGFSKVN